MTLNRNKNSNRYCGPAAIALLTGVHVDEAARALRIVSRKRAIKGATNRQMMDAMYMLGYMAVPVPTGATGKHRPTLTQVLAGSLRNRQPETAYLMVVTGHYVVIRGRKLYDNRHPDGIWLGECPYRRKRVRGLWVVEKHCAPTLPPKPPKTLTLGQFITEIEKLGLSTTGDFVDTPDGFHFPCDLHSLAVTGTYEEMLVQVRDELPLEACPQDCDCREEM